MNAVLLIALNDGRLRLRSWASGLSMLALVAVTWLLLRDPGDGMALISVNDARVIFDPQTMAIGSVSFVSILMSLFGVYLVRGQTVLEIHKGVGPLLASLPISSAQFVVGRWLGAIFYLLSLTLLYVLTLFALYAIRGEAPFSAGPIVSIVLVFMLPVCVYVASMAMLCDAIPVLNHRAGDVLYFIVWAAQMSLVGAMNEMSADMPFFLMFDNTGLVMLVARMEQLFVGVQNLNIGLADYNTALAAISMQGQFLNERMLGLRALTLLLCLLPLIPAILLFHRFDPVRVRQTRQQAHSLLARLKQVPDRLLLPLAQRVAKGLAPLSACPETLRIVIAELLLTLLLHPVMLLLLPLCWLLQLTSQNDAHILAVVLAMACAAVLSAEMLSRHLQLGTAVMRHAIAGIREHMLWQQFMAVVAVFLLFLWPAAIPQIAEASLRSAAMLLVLIGVPAWSCVAGYLTRSGKTFTIVFLFLLYLFLNAGELPYLDFAGLQGSVHAKALIVHGGLTLLALLLLDVLRRHACRFH